MKILILNDEPWDSGITEYSIQTAVLLKERGWEPVMGVRPGKIPEKKAIAAGLQTTPVETYWDVRALARKGSWDLINAHTGRTHTWAVLSRLFSFRGRRPVVRTRGDAREVTIHPLSRYIYNRTMAVITASNHIREQYQKELNWGEDRLSTIYPSVGLPTVPPYPEKPVVGILGRLDPVKGHSAFLEAVKRVNDKTPGVRFLIAGKEAGVTKELLLNHAKELGVSDQIEILGYVPSTEKFIAGCSFGVIASLGSEEVSRVCLEWMASARAVVGTLVGCLTELIEPEETGLLVPPGDSTALGDAMENLIRDTEKVRRWGSNARKQVEKRFSGSVQAERTMTIFSHAVDRFKNGRR